MRLQALCVIFLLVSASAQAKTYIYKQGMTFGHVDHLARKALLEQEGKLLEQALSTYNQQCQNAKKAFYSTIGGTFSCDFNVEAFSRGHTQNLVKGEMKNLPTNQINGVRVKLANPIRYSASLDPLHHAYKLDVLDYRQTILVNEKRNLFRNIHTQYAPYNHTLWTHVCSELPGLKLQTHLSPINVNAEKKIFWFVKAKARIEIDASLGSYWNRSTKLCGGAKIGYDRSKLEKDINKWTLSQSVQQPQFYIHKPWISPIQFKGVKVHKIRVKGNNLFTKIVFFLFKKLKNRIIEDIRKDLNKKLSQEIKKYVKLSNHELQSGHTWRKIARSQGISSQVRMVSSLKKPMIATMKEGLSKNLMIDHSEIDRYCHQFYNGLQDQLGVVLKQRACSQLVNQVEVIPFFRDPVQSDKGCYNKHHLIYNYNSFPYRPENLWWQKTCRLDAVLKITPNPTAEAAYSCLDTGLKKKWTQRQLVEKCAPTLLAEQLGLNPKDIRVLLNSNSLDDFFNNVQLNKNQENRVKNLVRLL